MPDAHTFTYQARIQVDGEVDAALRADAKVYGHAQRYLFADITVGSNTTQGKPAFMRRHGLTSRQYNAIDAGLKGKTAAIKERRTGLIKESATRIKQAEATITKLCKPAKASSIKNGKLAPEAIGLRSKRLFSLHQKKRRLGMPEARHKEMVTDDASGIICVAFGSRKLFRAQSDLMANGYADHAAWREDWRRARSSQFMVLGSKDETAGCQGCVATVTETGDMTLQVRLPAALAHLGKHVTINSVRFAYGGQNILKALAPSRVVTGKTDDGKPSHRRDGTALTYRFVRDKWGWRVMVSVAVAAVQQLTYRFLGATSIDIKRIDTVVHGKTTGQRAAVLGDTARDIAQMAKCACKPVVLERLNFQVKKSQLEGLNRHRSRILSALAYRQAAEMIKAACFRAGVEVIEVNPAYSSVISAANHAQQHGISVHLGAAVALARRGLGLSERAAVRSGVCPARNGARLTFELPVRNRSKHVWSFWSKVRTRLIAAHTEHVRSGGARRPPAPLRSSSQAERPTRILPVRPRHANRPPHCSGGVLQDIPWWITSEYFPIFFRTMD